MTLAIPDAATIARDIIARASNREQYVDGPVDRVMADAPWADRDILFSGLTAFHRERLDRIPSAEKFPEATPWVERRLAVERELIAAGLSEWDRAVLTDGGAYLAFRGYRLAAQHLKPVTGPHGPSLPEKCRIAYIPDTDEGKLFIMNADDPATFWTKDRTPASIDSGVGSSFWHPLQAHGVGSGMHLDTEPEEIFSVPAWEMYPFFCHDLPSVVEFLTRYGQFWSGCNIIIHDRAGESVAIEKCSRGYTEVFYPVADGRSHVSGMVCRDPNSPQGKHQRAMREEYVRMTGQTWDTEATVDVAFWEVCDLAHRILADFLNQSGHLTVKAVTDLFTTPFPRGLRKTGAKFHPNQGYLEYTLITYLALLDKRKVVRFQCDDPPDMAWPAQPEVYQV